MTPEEARSIRQQNVNASCFRQDLFFYFVPPGPENETVGKSWESYFKDALGGGVGDAVSRKVRERDNQRAFVLIETSPSPPANAYVAVNRKGLWYSISEDDIVSKANFALLNQIVTIQSVPQMNQQLQASIPVGR